MKKIGFAIGLIVLLVLASSQLVGAGQYRQGADEYSGSQGRGGPGHGHQGGSPPMAKFWMDSEIVQKINLTPEQIEKLETLEYEHRQNRITLKTELEKAHLELDRAFNANPLDVGQARKAGEVVAEMKGRMFMHSVDHHLTMRQVLTTDQWGQLDELRPFGPGKERRGMKRGYKNRR